MIRASVPGHSLARGTLNLLLLQEPDLGPGDLARVRGRRARHVREVLGAQVGQRITVGLLNGPLGRGELLEVSAEEVVLRVQLEGASPPASGIELLLALPRPKILRKVLQAAASMAVERLVLVNSFRVEKSYFDSPLLAPQALLEELVLGLEQGRHTRLPQVEVRTRFKPFVEDELSSLWPSSQAAKVLFHPGASGPLRPESLGAARLVAGVGPEGGWIPFEVDLLAQQGFKAVSLGPRPLRVDVAVPYLVGQLTLARDVARTQS
jgi:16S rRNA (uracil1498-N3)-methyltransferase